MTSEVPQYEPGTAASPPALLTLALIRKLYLPLGERTIFRMIAAGTFPRADLSMGSKVRLWKRETVEQWIESRTAAA